MLKANSFAIWRGGAPADFELKVEYRVSAAGNSGINYRSSQMPAPAFAMKGYQCDIDGANRYTGQYYEERARTFLALRGQTTRLTAGAKPAIIGMVGEKDALAAIIRADDWNQIHLIIRGNVLTHLVNGHVMSVVIDEDPVARTAAGLIGVQVHVGPPMKIEYRNFLLKTLPPLAPASVSTLAK
ncbi:MAG: glycosyl hydrolase [Verrucomicrobiales bacterium VVV1]|nr:MAG: glycosyl hydrolase [Verrucomicrobiales bacterium VVV1]